MRTKTQEDIIKKLRKEIESLKVNSNARARAYFCMIAMRSRMPKGVGSYAPGRVLSLTGAMLPAVFYP